MRRRRGNSPPPDCGLSRPHAGEEEPGSRATVGKGLKGAARVLQGSSKDYIVGSIYRETARIQASHKARYLIGEHIKKFRWVLLY